MALAGQPRPGRLGDLPGLTRMWKTWGFARRTLCVFHTSRSLGGGEVEGFAHHISGHYYHVEPRRERP